MPETNRIHIQLEKVHDIRKVLLLKPEITMQEYLELNEMLLEELRKEK